MYVENNDNPIFKKDIPRAKSNKLPARSTRIVLVFDDNSALYFNDMRKFGWMKHGKMQENPKGIDVLAKEFTLQNFKKALKNTRRPIKTVLLDQEKIAGIGNIYANDSLWEAQIKPDRKTDSLNKNEIKGLYKSVKETIGLGLKHKGSSADDELYILPDNTKGSYQNYFKTYQRKNEKCLRCDGIIEYKKIGGRGTFYCPKCQK